MIILQNVFLIGFFNYQQIGVIGDTIDLLVFLYWSNPDFNQQKLKKYLQNLLSEFATPFKEFHDRFMEKKDGWITSNIKNKKLKENLDKIENGLERLNVSIQQTPYFPL